jgi:isochorismate synthase
LEEAIPDINSFDIDLQKVALEKVFFHAIDKGLDTAVWRNPGEEKIHLIVNLSETQPETSYPDLETSPSGFLVSPYENDHNLLHYFINADLHFIYQEENLLKFKCNRNLSVISIDAFLENIPQDRKVPDLKQPAHAVQHNELSEKNKFEYLIKQSIDKIVQEEFQKVVPSRRVEIDLPERFNIVSKFLKLCHIHPQAFVSVFWLQGKGIWIGASPELLIKIDDRKFFYTSAVAGTQAGKGVINLSEVAWTQKEIEEQAFVSRYIINCFKKIRLREFEENGPRTVKAGGLLHLRTDYKVNLEAVNFPQLGSVMLKLLHPTSAVCGMPRESASLFLKEYEKIDREFYSGFLGPVNIDSETSLFVNLRCAKILSNKALLFAGAGVTRDSNPEKEWRETELKMNTIKEVLIS